LLPNPYSFGSYSYRENCPKLLANVVKVPPRGFELPRQSGVKSVKLTLSV